jgi:phenylpyruvate tautomerase PptA (4-oxalocrotonate tautomerase family)
MPFVNVKLIEGFFGADQKREIVEHLAETMVGIEGENAQPPPVYTLLERPEQDSNLRPTP